MGQLIIKYSNKKRSYELQSKNKHKDTKMKKTKKTVSD